MATTLLPISVRRGDRWPRYHIADGDSQYETEAFGEERAIDEEQERQAALLSDAITGEYMAAGAACQYLSSFVTTSITKLIGGYLTLDARCIEALQCSEGHCGAARLDDGRWLLLTSASGIRGPEPNPYPLRNEFRLRLLPCLASIEQYNSLNVEDVPVITVSTVTSLEQWHLFRDCEALVGRITEKTNEDSKLPPTIEEGLTRTHEYAECLREAVLQLISSLCHHGNGINSWSQYCGHMLEYFTSVPRSRGKKA